MNVFITELFRAVLSMSVTAAVVIAVVGLARLPLSKAPKAITCGLWFVALFRLFCPFSFESAVSLFTLGNSIRRQIPPTSPAYTGLAIPDVAAAAPVAAPQPTSPAPTSHTLSVMSILALIWAVIAAGLVVYGLISYVRLKRRIGTATLLEDGIYETDRFSSPFVAGFFRPAVYLPVGLDPAARSFIVAHEMTHIRRRDYIVKPLWYLAVCLHWFNPLVWLAFRLVSRDLEMRCDEAVIRRMGDAVKADYSSALLALSAPRKFFAGNPLSFGEGGVLPRIKKVLNFRRPVTWLVLVALAAAVTLTAALATNPKETKPERSLAAQYLSYKTDYVGDNAKVGGIISLFKFPTGAVYDGFELQTSEKPYGVTITLKADSSAQEGCMSTESHMLFMRNAAVLMSLVQNADSVSFDVKNTDTGIIYKFAHKRNTINTIFGPDVCAYAENEASFDGFLNLQNTPAPTAASADSGLPVSVEYQLFKLGKNGLVQATRSPLSAEQKTLLLDILQKCIIKEPLSPTVNPDSLDECYLIRTYVGGPTGVTSVNYYVFRQNGQVCLQQGKNGHYCVIDGKYYDALKAQTDTLVYQAAAAVEKNLTAIMSSPAWSSNPGDYIKAHRAEYDSILKMGDNALTYMLSCFEKGEGDTLKGYIMMALCNDILGARSTLAGQYLRPSVWYAKLENIAEKDLPDYVYTGSDPVTKLVYETETSKHQGWGGGFTVVAVHEFGRYEEGDLLKVIVSTYAASYHLYGRNLDAYTGSVIPTALTFKKNNDGAYMLSDYKQAEDGSHYAPSIRAFCTMPVSGKTIPSLADSILKDYGSGLKELQRSNLLDHLKRNGMTDVAVP